MKETTKPTFSKYGYSFQEQLLKLLVLEKPFCDQMMEILDVSYFETEPHRVFCKILFNYKEQYKTHPAIPTLETIINTQTKLDNINTLTQVKSLLSSMASSEDIKDSDFIKEKSLQFCRKQKIKEAMLVSIKSLEDDDFDSAHSKIDESFKLGLDNNVGHEHADDVDERYKENIRKVVPYPWDCLNKITKGGIGATEAHVVLAGTGCHNKGTQILMFDGTYKNVEDVCVGDLLMGPDSESRTVLNLVRGTGKMFKITPIKGKEFIVNEDHVLSLVHTTKNSILNISVKEYLSKSKKFKHLYKLYKTGVSKFENENKDVWEPYFVGLMGLSSLGSGDEYIPQEYKTSTLFNRLEILAGLIDKHGNKCHVSNGYEYVSKSKKLAEDVVFIASSVGLGATIKQKIVDNKIYYRVSIFGNTDIIPVRLDYKKSSERKQIKNHLRTGFSVEYLNNDDFYGFTIDKDNLYLFEDFFVTHNCGKSIFMVNFAGNAAMNGYNVIYYTFENPEYDIGQRTDAYLLQIPMDNLGLHKEEIRKYLKKLPGKLIIKSFPMHCHTIRAVENHLNRVKAKGIRVDAIVIDYAELMIPSDGSSGLDGEVKVIADTVSFAQRHNIPVLTAAQGNRDAIDEDVVTMKHVQGAYKKFGPIHFVLTLSQAGNAFAAKNRIGKSDITFPFVKNGDIMTIDISSPYEQPGTFNNVKKEIDPKQALSNFLEKQKIRAIK